MVASKMLVTAAAKEGKKVQAFPLFGAERRGAPVAAFARIDEQKIRIHSEVYDPDCVIVLDPVLYKTVNVTAGLKEKGTILLNTTKTPPDLFFSRSISDRDRGCQRNRLKAPSRVEDRAHREHGDPRGMSQE